MTTLRVFRLHLSVLLPCEWWGRIFLNHSNIEAVLIRRQPGDSPNNKTNSRYINLNIKCSTLLHIDTYIRRPIHVSGLYSSACGDQLIRAYMRACVCVCVRACVWSDTTIKGGDDLPGIGSGLSLIFQMVFIIRL